MDIYRRLLGDPVTGTSVDIHKCFDQINRNLAYKILLAAGMPHGVLCAYISYQENLKVYFAISGALGEAHMRKCGIPQGCPFSMCVVALMTRPWGLYMIALGASPRALADDMLVVTAEMAMAFEWPLPWMPRMSIC